MRTITVEPICEYGGEWTVAEFVKLVNDAAQSIPIEYLSEARVEIETIDDVGCKFSMRYRREETADEIAAREVREKEYAAQRAAQELAEFQRLRAKYKGF